MQQAGGIGQFISLSPPETLLEYLVGNVSADSNVTVCNVSADSNVTAILAISIETSIFYDIYVDIRF